MLENSKENTCVGESFLTKLQAWDLQLYFIKRDTPMQLFSCAFCEIFKNSFFAEYLLKTASEVKSESW